MKCVCIIDILHHTWRELWERSDETVLGSVCMIVCVLEAGELILKQAVCSESRPCVRAAVVRSTFSQHEAEGAKRSGA